MKKRLRYKLFNSCIVLKGFSATEEKEIRTKICKDMKELRYFYKTYLGWRKKGIKAEFTFAKNDDIDEEDEYNV